MNRLACLLAPVLVLAVAPTRADAGPRTTSPAKTAAPKGKAATKAPKIAKLNGRRGKRSGMVAKLAPKAASTSVHTEIPSELAARISTSKGPRPSLGKAELEAITDLKVHDMNWATLTPIAPWRTGRAKLSFFRSIETPSHQGEQVVYATFTNECALGKEDPCISPFTEITVEAPAAGLYIVQCNMMSLSNSSHKWIVEANGDVATMSVGSLEDDWVVFVLEAGGPGSYHASLRGTMHLWALFQCKVNPAG